MPIFGHNIEYLTRQIALDQGNCLSVMDTRSIEPCVLSSDNIGWTRNAV
jgi:hypothetical protein